MAEIFVVRILRDVREKMRNYRHVNWSMVVREAILRKLKEIEEIVVDASVVVKWFASEKEFEKVLRSRGRCLRA